MAKNRYDQDEEFSNKVQWKYFAKLGKYMAPYKGMLIIGIILILIIAFLELLPPYCISIVIDTCLPNNDYKLLIGVTVVLLISMGVIWFSMFKRSYITNDMAMRIIKDLRSDLFKHLQYLPLSYFDSRPHGKILVRVVNYTNTLCGLLANSITDMIANAFKLVLIVGFMFAMNVKFTLMCLAAIPVFLIVLSILRRRHTKAWRTLSAKQSNLNAYLQESISGIKITQSFARENINAGIFDGLCEDNKQAWMKAKRVEIFIPRFVTILMAITRVLVYVIGGYMVIHGQMKVGMLIAFAAYVSNFWSPITIFANFYNELTNCGAYLERIFELLEEPLVVEDLPDAKPMKKVEGNVRFDNVTFRYEEDAPNILENVSFDVKAGQRIAIVGPTGAGKSTIINTLARFYDIQDGKITIDGQDIKHATLNSLRSQMGIMLQDSFLFSGTIMDNIRYSKRDATDEEVVEAAKAVCAHDFIMEFPDGYNTEVNEGGSMFSAGQKQLIAFARALLADPAILILDEATSSIDTETEIVLQKGLDKLLEGRTSFIIAHRLSTIKNSDRIMYICDKKIAESGTHHELIEKKGRYYKLYMAQYKFLEQM